jgi:hypothetical protein
MPSLLPQFRQLRVRNAGAAALLSASLAAGSAQALTIVLPFSGSKSYAECVIRRIDPKTGTVAVSAIESECRTAFPQPSRRSLFGPRTVGKCYSKYEKRAAHRTAAEAIYGACQDYFRRG